MQASCIYFVKLLGSLVAIGGFVSVIFLLLSMTYFQTLICLVTRLLAIVSRSAAK